MFCIACQLELDIETAYIEYDHDDDMHVFVCADHKRADAVPVAGPHTNKTTLDMTARAALQHAINNDDDMPHDDLLRVDRALASLPDGSDLPTDVTDCDIDHDDPATVVRVALTYYF